MHNKHLPLPPALWPFWGLFLIAAGLALPLAARAQDAPAPARASAPSVLQRMIETAFHGGAGKIVIPPGTYRVKPQDQAHIYLAGIKDFEIDATGVTLVFTDTQKPGIFFDGCENVSFHGATLIHDPVSFSQGTVEAIGLLHTTFDVRIAAGYPSNIDDPHFFPPSLMVGDFDPKTRQWKANGRDYDVDKIQKLDSDLFRFHLEKPVMPGEPLSVGDPVAWRGAGAADLEVYNCSRMNLKDVTVRSGAGFGVYEYGAFDNHYTNYSVLRGPRPDGADEDPLLAANADGFHSNGARKGPTLENCVIEDTNDDGIMIHGTYALVIGAAGKRLLLGELSLPFCVPGDTLVFTGLAGEAQGEAKVVSVEDQADYKPGQPAPADLRLFQNPPWIRYQNVVLDREVPAASGWMVGNADACGNGFTIRNCTIRNNRARGIILRAGGLVEGSTVEGTTLGGIMVATEIGEWNEANYARGLVLRNNVIRHAALWRQPGNPFAGALSVAAYEHGRYVPLPGGFRDIVISGNRFEEDDGPNLVVSSAQGIRIEGNQFIRPMRNATPRGSRPGVPAGALVWITESSGVKVSGLSVTEPGSALKQNVVVTGTVTGMGF